MENKIIRMKRLPEQEAAFFKGESMSQQVVIKDAVKTYGNFNAVDHVDLKIEEGELFTLLGPSGCGKTTLLRMIAGFNSIEGGVISFGEKVINDIPAHKRNIGMVFQNYAIFPHMTVFENVAYGLKARKLGKEEIERRVNEALEMVKIQDLKDRQPANMSGGQQQRVALARSIVIHPDILLMDEPLSNLDAKLRVEMRTTIKKVQRKLGITTIYVTHDQEEALAISDRIAIMKSGRIQQVGIPKDIYTRPTNEFVANFIGTSNVLEGRAVESKQGLTSICVDEEITIDLKLKKGVNGRVKVSIRPEEFIITGEKENAFEGRVDLKVFLGDFINYEVVLKSGVTVEVNQYIKDAQREYEVDEKIYIRPALDKINVFDELGEEPLICES